MERKRSREERERVSGGAAAGDPPPRSTGRPLPPPPPFPPRGPPGPPPPPRPRFQPIDREKLRAFLVYFDGYVGKDTFIGYVTRINLAATCPLLLRVFTKNGGHHTQEDFSVRGKEPKDEVQIYTWMDATLRELTDLVKEVSPAARRRDAKLSFAVVYPDKNGRMQVKKVGETFSNANKRRLDDNKALAEIYFQIGDYLDVSIE
ncbi:Histone deacetylase complex subunit SAP18 [Bienertia sinuspersici]